MANKTIDLIQYKITVPALRPEVKLKEAIKLEQAHRRLLVTIEKRVFFQVADDSPVMSDGNNLNFPFDSTLELIIAGQKYEQVKFDLHNVYNSLHKPVHDEKPSHIFHDGPPYHLTTYFLDTLDGRSIQQPAHNEFQIEYLKTFTVIVDDTPPEIAARINRWRSPEGKMLPTKTQPETVQ